MTAKGTSVARKARKCVRCKGKGEMYDPVYHDEWTKLFRTCWRCHGTGVEPRRKGGKS